MPGCATCRLKARYDASPRSLTGRLWKWHIRWCPGWRSYLKTLPPSEHRRVMAAYGPHKERKRPRPQD